MSLLVLGAEDLYDVLCPRACAAVMRQALSAHATAGAFQPLRTVARPPGAGGLMVLMPSFIPPPGDEADEPGYGLKALCISPGNPALGKDSHQGVVLISSAQTGEPLALLNAATLTEIRTAAVSVVATGLLARPDAAVLAIIGTGVQARAHARAMGLSRTLTQIRVAGRAPERARQCADDIERMTGIPAAATGSVREALAGADIVVTATTSPEPVLRREWLEDGAHVNAVGACLPGHREIDSRTMADAALFVDSRESAAAESGDFLLAVAEGAIGDAHIQGDLGELLAGSVAGRRDDRQITLFESLGLAVEDFAAAAHAYRTARALGAGTWVDL